MNDLTASVWTGLAAVGAWVGHAYLLTGLLNGLYGQPYPKRFLKSCRLAVGLLILGFPLLYFVPTFSPILAVFPNIYVGICTIVGLGVFPGLTLYRVLRPRPTAVRSEHTETVDYLTELGPSVIGNGYFSWLVRRLPVRATFRVDYTDMTLAVPNLPAALDGLTVLLVTDTHFHGTPSRAFYDAIVDRIVSGPPVDVVVLGGDYLDKDDFRPWIGEILGRLKGTDIGLAILGNHDVFHDPAATRNDLESAGFTVLSNRWEQLSIRGVPCLVSGHEGPWIGTGPDLTDAPTDLFHICVSHTPDQFEWAGRSGVNLLLCGHVHGGQIRLPVIGSIFVPSRYGRRFDMGVFERPGMVMVVSRGLGGKEPLRIRCNPQVLRLTLTQSG